MTCTFPDCPVPSCGSNDSGQPMCVGHQRVTVSGSYVNDKHKDGGHG